MKASTAIRILRSPSRGSSDLAPGFEAVGQFYVRYDVRSRAEFFALTGLRA